MHANMQRLTPQLLRCHPLIMTGLGGSSHTAKLKPGSHGQAGKAQVIARRFQRVAEVDTEK